MPNWCENDLLVRGPADDVAAFLNLMQGESPFDFGKVIPYPEEFRRLDEITDAWDIKRAENPELKRGPRPIDGFNSGGHEWCVKNWGTKWPASAIRIDEAKDTGAGFDVVIHFNTAWSPPLPVIMKASSLFQSLVFELRYFDGGAGFQGKFVAKNGECEHDESSTYRGTRGG